MSPQAYGNFTVTRVCDLSEIKCTLTELIHEPTGAQILHIANPDDDENVFNLSFRTWPEKSNGVAHILEHTVLCGSEKFPVRDPFFGMSRRSLNTFMNAITGGDFTCYPAASQVPQDFYNLLDVYLDAVFKPKLQKLSFLQEGHRLEFFKPDDPTTPLIYKGVVFNEMKGALSTGEARLGEAIMHSLFPNLTYGINSGGEPREIINLTYEELKDFHAKFYHPSRCLYYFYGNLPLEQHLTFLENNILKNTKRLSNLRPLAKQPRFAAPVRKELTYPIAEDEESENKTLIGMAWLTCSILEQEELLALNVLDLVLMGTDAAPLKMALLKSNLCKQTDSAIDNDISEIPYILICTGCSQESGEALEKLVYKTLKDIARSGLPPHLIEGSIHQLEMARSEITGTSAPYGLALFFRSALLKQHGGNPDDGLRIHTLFHHVREKTKDPNYLPGLIEKYFLQNPHFVRIDMHPDKTLAAQEIEEEETRLQNVSKALTKMQIDALITQARELEHYQESQKEEDLELLPKVSLEDVSRVGKEFPLTQEKWAKFELFCHPCFTNELVYADLIFDLPQIEEKELPYLRLFVHLLPHVGCGGRNYQEHLEYLLEHTGGVNAYLDLCTQAADPTAMRPAFVIKGKALHRKMDKLFPLLRDMVMSADFSDASRLQELLKQHYHGLETSIHHSSLRYAVNLAASGISIPSKIVNALYGLDYYWAVKKIIAAFESNPNTLITRLQTLQETYLGLEGAHLVLGCDEKSYKEIKREGGFGLQEISAKPFKRWEGNYALAPVTSQGRITASPVAFTAYVFPSVAYTHPEAPSLSIASQIMENKTLHKRIREQGGAYGSGAVLSALAGQFYFFSYRDPHLAYTLGAFEEAVEASAKGQFDERDIEEAKLGLFQDLDSPLAPGSRSITTYFRLRSGRTAEVRQAFRNALFEKQKKEIKEAVHSLLVPAYKKGILVSFAGKELLEKENGLLKEKSIPIFPI